MLFVQNCDGHTMEQILVVLCGIPASGKSTLARELASRMRAERQTCIVDTDRWRAEVYGGSFSPEKERLVRGLSLREVRECLRRGWDAVHDDTNYYASMRHDLRQVALEEGCRFGVVHVATPLSVALGWNRTRPNMVPEHVIRKIAERLDVPGQKYAWDRPVATVDLAVTGVEEAAGRVLRALRQLARGRERRVTHGTHAEELDRTTRGVVRQFLSEHLEMMGEPAVHRARKEVLRQALREGRPPSWAARELRLRLRGVLDRAEEDRTGSA